MYMSAKDGGGARPGTSCRGSARPQRLFPARVVGATPGLRRRRLLPPLQPPPPDFPAQRPAHPSRKQNGGRASPIPTRREPFSTRWRGRCGAEKALLLCRRRDTARGSRSLLFCSFSSASLAFRRCSEAVKAGKTASHRSRGPPKELGKVVSPLEGRVGRQRQV